MSKNEQMVALRNSNFHIMEKLDNEDLRPEDREILQEHLKRNYDAMNALEKQK